MSKVAFLGFGEVNTPVDVIVRKCSAAAEALKAEGLDLVSVYPIADDYEEKDVAKAVEALKEVNGQMFICADHGNAEQLLDYETGAPFTAHTTNPVPFILVNADPSYTLKEGGCLADIAPTLIELMGMEQPKEMSGTSLLVK